jgi:amidase
LASGYAVHAKASGASGSLKGMRIGIVRESMLNPGTKAAEPITTAAAKEIKTVLGGKLGATLVESSDPLWKPDSDIEQMKVDFRRALAYLVPIFMPDILFRLTPAGEPVFPDFAAAIVKTEFAPGRFFGSGTLTPIEYMVRLADGLIDAPGNLDISTVQDQELAPTFHFHIRQYLSRRAADWAALGHEETLTDWKTLNARSKFWGDDQRAAWKNWEEVADPRNKLGGRQGVDERIMLRELLRRVDMMVILENKLDAIVRLHTPLPPARIGYPDEPGLIARLRNESQYGPNAGLTEVLIPAGYVTTAYDAEFTLSADGKKYVGKASAKPTQLAAPGLPFSLVFRAEPGKEDVVLKIAAAYEGATKHRVPPPAFGPVGAGARSSR